MTSSSISDIAARLVESYDQYAPLTLTTGHDLPSPPEVAKALTELREVLFPGLSGGHRARGAALRTQIEARLAQVRVRLVEQIFRGLHYRSRAPGGECQSCSDRAAEIVDAFMTQLPSLRALLMTDVQAAQEGDPAATGLDEIIFSYPGIQAITVYRIAHALLKLGAVITPRMMTEIAHSETGIDIHPGAQIGEGFFIDHGTGVVIGETTVIGKRVRIYQGVTLGAMSLSASEVPHLKNRKRHPTIEDEVIIYANATILGGDTVIGRGAVIGGNSWITQSVPARR
jgi:serine O-acetyltransferase